MTALREHISRVLLAHGINGEFDNPRAVDAVLDALGLEQVGRGMSPDETTVALNDDATSVEKKDRALASALNRVLELQAELDRAAIRLRNANEARQRAHNAAARAGVRAADAERERDRFRSQAEGRAFHSDAEMWTHRQWVFLFTLATSRGLQQHLEVSPGEAEIMTVATAVDTRDTLRRSGGLFGGFAHHAADAYKRAVDGTRPTPLLVPADCPDLWSLIWGPS